MPRRMVAASTSMVAVTAAVLAAFLASGTARANLLINGDFQSDYDSSNTGNVYCSTASCNGAITGWTTTGNAYTTDGGTAIPPNEMNAYIGVGSLSQTIISPPITGGDEYVVTFYLAADGNTVAGYNPARGEFDYANDNLNVALTNASVTDLLDVNLSTDSCGAFSNSSSSSPTDPFLCLSYTPGQYVEFTETVEALASAPITLTFTADDVDEYYYVDDVSVDPVTAPVPEPASIALLLAPLLGFGAHELRRCRGRKAG